MRKQEETIKGKEKGRPSEGTSAKVPRSSVKKGHEEPKGRYRISGGQKTSVKSSSGDRKKRQKLEEGR